MENLLLDQKFWLTSLEEDIAIEVSIQEETLNLIYKGILMQEGRWWNVLEAKKKKKSATVQKMQIDSS